MLSDTGNKGLLKHVHIKHISAALPGRRTGLKPSSTCRRGDVLSLLTAVVQVCELQSLMGSVLPFHMRRALPEAAMLAHHSLRDLRLTDCWLTTDAVARLAPVAARLRVLHLKWYVGITYVSRLAGLCMTVVEQHL